jgi:hypothetical protein
MHPSRQFVFALFALAAPAIAQGGWVQRFPAHSPFPRAQHGLVYDVQRGVHVLFGGYGTNGANTSFNDTWEWNGLDWVQRTPATVPPARTYHAMAYDFSRGRVVMFGGVTASGMTNAETWEFDGVNWALRSSAQSPLARHLTGMAFSNARLRTTLFGGHRYYGSSVPPLQDTWEWDGTNWTQLAPAHLPPRRFGHGMTSDVARSRLLVFGGFDGTTDLADAWAFDGVDWTPLPATQSPPPRTYTTIVADPARGMLVQFGGVTYVLAQPLTNDTWLHDDSDWRPDVRPTGNLPRSTFGFSYDWVRDRAVLFGGQDLGTFNGQTWEYDLAGVALWSVTGAGCAGTQGVPQLRPADWRRAILGRNFGLAVSGGVAGGALFGVGFSDTNWNGTPLPLSLASLAMPGCQLHVSPELTRFAGSVGGTAQFWLAIPSAPSLVGVRLHAQALVPQPGVNALGAVMSNAVLEVVGAF